MKYIRTKDGIYKVLEEHKLPVGDDIFYVTDYKSCYSYEVLKQADTIEDLIQIGDIVFYWAPGDDKEHCVLINYDIELDSIKYDAITKLLIPVGEDYKCVAKGYPSFNLIKNKRYLANKGELELL